MMTPADLAWVADHGPGFVINTYRTPTAAYLKLHRAICPTITGAPAHGSTFTGGDYSKVCGDREDLEAFAVTLGGGASPCGLCLRRWAPPARPSRRDGSASADRQVPDVREQRQNAGHVFISYVREDAAAVDRLQRMLEVAGIRVWRDTADLSPGEDWAARIRQAITDDALVFIACFSKASMARERTYQREELLLALGQMRLRRPDEPWLIPVRFDDCSIPAVDIGAGRTLAAIHWADLFGSRSGENTVRLIGTVERILSKRSSSANRRTEARSLFRGFDLPIPIVSAIEGLYANNPAQRVSSIWQIGQGLRSGVEYHWPLTTVLEEFLREAAGKADDLAVTADDGTIAADVAEAIKALAYRARVWEPRGLDLKDTDLRGARIPRAWFPRANLSNAWLDAAELMEAHLEGTDLRRARLSHANLRRAHLADSDMRGAILYHTRLVRADMRNSRLGLADLSFASLHRANFIGARLDDADLSRADTAGAVGLNLQ